MSRLGWLAGLVTLAVGLGGCATLGEAAGPWRGQVLDAETGQPLEGVVVLAVWEKVSPGVMHMARDFHDVDETVTDAEGRFLIPARNVATINPFTSIEGPKLTMFKGGYGLWGFRKTWQGQVGSYEAALKRFAETGAVFDLPPLKTPDERRNRLPTRPFGVPDSRMPRFLEALSQERVFLGYPPLRKPKSEDKP